MKIGFVGLGIMGSRMAANLLKAGYDVKVFNRTLSRAEELKQYGALICTSVPDAAKGVDVLFTMLSDPDAVKETASGEKGFLSSMKKNSVWVDCSTVNPSFSREMAKAANEKGIRFIDAPVAGTKLPAEKGELIIFAGGSKKDIEEVTPFLNMIGKKIIYAGDNGKATSLKMLVNGMLSAAMEIFSETLVLGEALGFSKEQLSEVLIGSPVTAPFLAAKKTKIDAGNFDADFPLQLMFKDTQLILQTTKENNLSLPGIESIKKIYSDAVDKGLGEMDFSAVYNYVKSLQQKSK